jgi:hypothetical protein
MAGLSSRYEHLIMQKSPQSVAEAEMNAVYVLLKKCYLCEIVYRNINRKVTEVLLHVFINNDSKCQFKEDEVLRSYK